MLNSEEIVQKLVRLKQLGVSISVDDFGTGYSSLAYLKLLPLDCVKIDRAFVRDIVHDADDKAIVEAVIAMGHALGLRVIAEGVETVEQERFLREHGCNEAQGYFFCRPLEPLLFQEYLAAKDSGVRARPAPPGIAQRDVIFLDSRKLGVPGGSLASAQESPVLTNVECAGDICLRIPPAHPGDNLATVLKRFQTEKGLLVLPVVENGQVAGVLNRSTFLEEHVIGMHGFAFQINHSKKLRDLMRPVSLSIEAATSIRSAARAIQELGADCRIDNVCVTRNSRYVGIIDVNRFVGAITEINLSLAKGANPLTGLPGNESIQREITERLKSGRAFDIAYIDIDNFKPYNDYYGFQMGDTVIKLLGEIISTTSGEGLVDGETFCGHIGGDDFIVITEPGKAQGAAGWIIQAFEEQRAVFHGPRDAAAGFYISTNRKGEREEIALLSLSIGIVNTLLTPVDSYGQLASLSTEVKRLAKKQSGSSVVINRRVQGQIKGADGYQAPPGELKQVNG